MSKNYEHKFDSKRKLVAAKVTEQNQDLLAEWYDSALDETPNVGDYVVLDSEGVFHVRPASVFEAKYVESDDQNQAFDFDETPMEDEHVRPIEDQNDYTWQAEGVESDEKGFIPSTPDELNAEDPAQ